MVTSITPPTGDKKEDKKEWGKYTRPGDIHNMKCHDCCGWLSFLIILAAFIAILCLGVSLGRPWVLLNSWDDTGNYCGKNNSLLESKIANMSDEFKLYDFTDQPFLFFAAPRLNILGGAIEKPGDIQICVKECPAADSYETAFNDNCVDSTRVCPSYFTDAQRTAEMKKGGACVCPYPSHMVMNRCIPKIDKSLLTANVTNFFDAVTNLVNTIPGFGQSMMACADDYVEILVCSVASLVIAFIWVFLLRCLTGFIVYIAAIAVPIIIAALGVYLYFNGAGSFGFNNDQYNKYMSYALFAVAAILLIIIIFLWSRLKQAVAVMKIAAKALGSNITALFAPVLTLVFILVFWAAIIVSCCYNYTTGDFSVVAKENGKLDLVMVLNEKLQYLLIFNLIFLVYISVHCYFVNYYAVSASVVEWYFGEHGNKCCNCRCLYGFWLAWTKSLGTITVSALIMTPIYLFIIFMEYLDAKSKQDPSALGTFVKFLIKCMKCCLWCFEKIMRYLNKSLMTFSQIYNKSWLKSAKLTMDILLSDIITTLLVNGISSFILFLSKVVVCGLSTLIFFLWIKYQNKEKNGWLLPSAIVFLLSYVISSFVINMFDSLIDIVFICYLSDKDLTKDGAIRPMYIDSEMNQIVDNMKKSQAKDGKVEAAEKEEKL